MKYKESRYNFYMDYDEKKLVFNGVTSAFAEIDEQFLGVIEKANNDDEIDENVELVSQMHENGFLVEKGFDELKYLKLGNYGSKFESSEFGLTIAPTLACNFACPYCYETPEAGVMSEEVMSSLCELVNKMAEKKKNVGITWYGGEPILAKNIIENLSDRFIEIANKQNVEYSAYMVSNGYLIDKDVVGMLKKCRVSGVQLTIDGPPGIHNERRRLKSESGDTFWKIVETAKLLKAESIEVHIRINIDKANVDCLEELLDILIENDLQDCSVNLGHIKPYTNACASVVDACLNPKDFAMLSTKCQSVLVDKGFRATLYPYYPGLKGNYCCADSTSAYVIDPKGYMYKCWNDIGNTERSVGNVLNCEEMTERNLNVNAEYILWSPFEFEKCVECKMLPMCMGGCPYNGIASGIPECENWKYSLRDTLINIYEQQKAGLLDGLV